jgi:hypothetical protein
MRRSRLVQVLGGAALAAALLLPSTALAASALPAATTAATAPSTTAVPAPIKLSCSLVLQNPLGPAAPRRANVCTWTAPADVVVKTYRLWRIVDARPATRTLIAAIAGAEPLRYGDTAIRSFHTYTYWVSGVGADGTRVALSNRVSIHVPRAIETLAMTCAFATVGDATGVSCHWAASTRAAADHYVLLRSVDGGARQRIYRTWIHGRRTFLDTDVKPGQTVRYAVLALTAHGVIVGRGGPVVVTIPAASSTTSASSSALVTSR